MERREWYIHSRCMYKSVFKWYTTNLFCWTCSRVCNQKWLGLAKSWFTRPKVNPRQANRILSHAKPVTFCFPFHFTFNTIQSESSLPRIENLSELFLRRHPSSGRLLLSTLSLLIKHSPCPLTGMRHQPEKK